MSPRRLDPSIVQARLSTMRALLDDLAAIVPDADIHSDRMLRHAVERILTQLVELAASVNEHVVGARVQQVATSYRESFELAAECGLIDADLRDELLPSVGLRNVLVHEYLAVDLGIVAAAIPRAINGYRSYVAQVAAFVDGIA
jgi:uncharacterized protein YutE (UPF0331/DUF86 family)